MTGRFETGDKGETMGFQFEDRLPARGDDEELLFGGDDEPLATDSRPASPLKPVPLLIVDDEAGIHAITEVALANVTYHGRALQLLSAYSAREARALLAQRTDIAVILLDVVMETDEAGLQLVQWIREELGNREVRIILRTGQPGQAPERRVIVEYQINDYKAKTELTADKLFTAVVAAIRSYEDIQTKSHLLDQLERAQRATVVTLAACAEYKDTDTGDHVLRVAEMSTAIARRLNQTGPYSGQFKETTLEMIGMASILHDVGKMAIPDAILQKPGPLTSEERLVMQTHVERGEAILKKACQMTEGVTYLTLGAEIAASHHERWDGTGYPRGLAGDEIPLTGRIVALVDVFDALSYARPYKPAWSSERVLEAMRQWSGSHFDPAVVDAFFALHAPADTCGGEK
ncbi:MAG: HD domain-containing protein [Magnetococcus sp. MYC-9]